MATGNGQRWWQSLMAVGFFVVLASASPAMASELSPAGFLASGGGDGGLGGVFWMGINETPIGWIIIGLSVLSFALIVENFLTIRRTALIPEQLPGLFEVWIKERQYTEMMQYLETDKSMLGQTVAAALQRSRAGFEAMKEAAETMGSEQLARMFRKVEWLNVLGGLGPLLGLMGTVLGMVISFSEMTKKGATAKPEELAAGISIALINTFLGLFVAAPSLVAYGFFRTRIDNYGSEANMLAMEIVENFRPGSKSGGAASAAPGPQASVAGAPAVRPNEASRQQMRPAAAPGMPMR